MIISNITPPQVWSASARSLTNIGSGALAATQTLLGTLAGAASVDLRFSAGQVGELTVAVITGPAATLSITILMFDGTNSIIMATTGNAPSANAAFTTNNNNSVGLRLLNNDATHAGNYLVTGKIWTP